MAARALRPERTRRTADPEGPGELSLGGQPIPGVELSGLDEPADVLRDAVAGGVRRGAVTEAGAHRSPCPADRAAAYTASTRARLRRPSGPSQAGAEPSPIARTKSSMTRGGEGRSRAVGEEAPPRSRLGRAHQGRAGRAEVRGHHVVALHRDRALRAGDLHPARIPGPGAGGGLEAWPPPPTRTRGGRGPGPPPRSAWTAVRVRARTPTTGPRSHRSRSTVWIPWLTRAAPPSRARVPRHGDPV